VEEEASYYREYYKESMSTSRTAFHTALNDKHLYSANAGDTEFLSFLVNNVMMDNDGLPDANTLEGLLVLRQAWDLTDIGRHVLKKYKFLAKGCYLIMILLAIAITVVSIEKDGIDASNPTPLHGR
jgi:hypothetical protein